jgi:hypothetical protein
MKIFLAVIIVLALARLISGVVMVIVNLPLGIIFELWGDKAPHFMRGFRLCSRTVAQFLAIFCSVVITVIFSYYIFNIVAHNTYGGTIPLLAVTVPMLFSMRRDREDWKKMHDAAWNFGDKDASIEMRKHIDSEHVMIHRVGVFAKGCALIAAWIYFLIIGDGIILPYLGIKYEFNTLMSC